MKASPSPSALVVIAAHPMSPKRSKPKARPLHRVIIPHLTNHGSGKFATGAGHTNTIEDFRSLIKRGVMGSYHKVSRKYLPLYVAEFQFRYNNRLNHDIF
jgi:hypothetical protein